MNAALFTGCKEMSRHRAHTSNPGTPETEQESPHKSKANLVYTGKLELIGRSCNIYMKKEITTLIFILCKL